MLPLRPLPALALLCCLLLAACGEGITPLPRGTGGPPLPLALGTVVVDVPRGGSVGGYGFGLLCRPPFNEIAWNQRPSWDTQLSMAVRDGMAAGGAPLADDKRHGPLRPAQPWELSARITALTFDLCRANDFWFDKPIGETGTATVSVEWTLRRDGRPPQVLTSHGRGGTDIPASDDGKLLILGNALADAARQLASRPDFRRVLANPAAEDGVAAASAPAASPTLPASVLPPPSAPVPAPAMMAASLPPSAPSPASFAEPGTMDAEGEAVMDATPPAVAIGDPLLSVQTPSRQRPALLLGLDGLALMPLDMQPDWLAAGAAPALPVRGAGDTGGQAVPLAWDRLAAAMLLRVEMGAHPLPGLAPARPRSPPVGSLLHPPGKPDRTVMITARREEGPLPILLLDLPPGLAPPPFLLDDTGRLAAVIAGPALPGDLQPYHPAGPLLTRLREKLPPAGAPQPAP